MDLYGQASTGQVNAANQMIRSMNQSATDFNASLSAQADAAKTASDSEATGVLEKNLLSTGTSGGKLLLKPAALSAAGTKVAQAVGAAAPDVVVPENLTYVSDAGEAVTQDAAVLGAKDAAGAAVAGVGGVLDIVKDVERDGFGTNMSQKVGNIGNIIGSGLEVAGIASGGITPWSLALEGTGAAISFISSIVETGGDIAEGDVEASKAQTDIESQQRGQSVAQKAEVAVGGGY
mgnify:FL=1|tara:strand:- start:5038 stop:5739 length:702 start_codon:yes stop_codon:yes gene_type:complete